MIPYTRKKKIVDLIEEKEMVRIEELLNLLPEVSESTIRRDLQSLAQEGKLILLRGGAAKMKTSLSIDLPIETKLVINREAKERISKFAASLIKDGEVVYLDASTTVIPMVKYLAKKRITVVTTCTLIPNMLNNANANVKCIILGGEVINNFGSIVGTITENLLSTMFFDKAFMGANGFSLDGGISSAHFTEAAKMKIVNKNSKITYIMMDISKAGKTSLCKVFDLNECNIITDKHTELLEHFKSCSIVQED